MIEIAVLKLKPVAGVKNDEWDEDGELELSNKFEIVQTFKRVLIHSESITKNVAVLNQKPDAILINYNNLGYA